MECDADSEGVEMMLGVGVTFVNEVVFDGVSESDTVAEKDREGVMVSVGVHTNVMEDEVDRVAL